MIWASVFLSIALSQNEEAIDFRCRFLQAYDSPRQVVCQKDVLLKRGDTLLCCDRFEGYADRQGDFTRLVCIGDVRALRGNEMMWAEQADYRLDIEDIVLSGRPELLRGKSRIRGRRIVIDPDLNQAQVEYPQGALKLTEQLDTPDQISKLNKLPKQCPLPPKPR